MRRPILLLALLISIGGILAGALGPGLEEGDRLWPTVWLLWGIVGYLILLRRPGNGVGTAALLVGVSWGIAFGLGALSFTLSGAPAAWAELINVVLGVVPWLAIIWLLLVFPSGVVAGRGERIVGTAVIVFGVVVTLAFALHPAPMEFTGLPSPLGVPALSGTTTVLTSDGSFSIMIGLVVATLVLLVLRWRRSTGIERLQYRWLLLGGSLFVLITALGQFLSEDSRAELLWLLGGSAIPVSIGIAILRYRLYEIDRLISRTVTYALVVGILALVFATGVVWIPSALGLGDTPLVVAGSTLAVAALFNPVRRRVQSWVDRRFNRSRYDAARVVARFSGSLRDEIDPDRVVRGWVSVVSETMHPASVGVWLQEAR